MRCLVTGSAGFLGSHLVARLLESGHAVTILLRPTSNTWRIERCLPDVEIIFGDLKDSESIGDRLKAARPEIVYHLAWIGGNSGRHQNDLSQIQHNLPASLAFFRQVTEAGARRWIGCGSAAEYGLTTGPVSEATVPQPHTLYGISKYALCLATAKMCSLLEMEYLWARPFALYGPQDQAQGLIPFIVRSLLRGERPSLTAGEQRWDYLHVEDAAQALMCLASTPGGGPVNIGSGEPVTIRELVEQIRDLINPALPLGFGEVPYPVDQLMSLQADTTKLRRLASWTPQVPLKDGLRLIIEEYRSREENRSGSSRS